MDVKPPPTRPQRLTLVACAAVAAAVSGCQSATTPEQQVTPAPPRADAPPQDTAAAGPPPTTAIATPRQELVDVLHGHRVRDPYRWLEDASTDRTRQWMRQQDAVARAYLAKLPGRELLHDRLRALSYIDMVNPPIHRGTRYFYSRQHAHKEKVVWYWREGEDGKPRVLIDPNTLSDDGSISLRGLSISWDGRSVAYKLSQNAADQATLYVMEVATGKTSKVDVIKGARYAHASWTPDGEGFYYTRLPVDPAIPAAELPGHAAVYFHRLGSDPTRDRLIHPATGDPRKFIGVDLSRDGRYLFLYVLHGWTKTDLYLKKIQRRGRRAGYPPRGKKTVSFAPLAVGLPAHFSVEAWKRWLYVHTDHEAPRYRLCRVHPDRLQRSAWEEIVPERKDAVLEGFSIVGGHLALRYLKDATTRLEIARLDGTPRREIAFPGLGTASGLRGNPDEDTAYYSYSSFTTPDTVYRTSVRDGGRDVYSELEVPIDSRPYLVEQVRYPSRDGTPISMFIVHRRDMPLDGSTPFLLTGYGGFNINITPRFKAEWFVWLEQGGGVAIPNLRGGGEYGEEWHRAGMLTHKQNTFDDFIAAAEHLISGKYTSADRLAIRGGSNGGLLVGAAMTQRPELFRAVACHVPLLDMVRYHLFGAGKTWISEYGSADNPEQLEALLAYSPYHRVQPSTAYPALLVLSADSDDRVDPMHARKFVAAVQHASTSGRPALLRIETKAGHGGGDMVKKKVAAGVDEFAFLLHELGVRVEPPTSANQDRDGHGSR